MSIAIPYSNKEQRELILAKVKAEHKNLQNSNFGEVLESNCLIKNGRQVFAIFDDQAFEVSDIVSIVDDTQLLFSHASIDGKSFYSCSCDGGGGILTWLYLTQRAAWILSWCAKHHVCVNETGLA